MLDHPPSDSLSVEITTDGDGAIIDGGTDGRKGRDRVLLRQGTISHHHAKADVATAAGSPPHKVQSDSTQTTYEANERHVPNNHVIAGYTLACRCCHLNRLFLSPIQYTACCSAYTWLVYRQCSDNRVVPGSNLYTPCYIIMIANTITSATMM